MAFESVAEQIEKYAKAYTQKFKSELKVKVSPPSSGRLARSIKPEIGKDSFSILANSYIQQLSEGRNPGKPPPSDKILDWIRVKGIRPRKGSASPGRMRALAFVISRSIGLHGYKGNGIIDFVYNSLAKQMGDDLFKAYRDDLEKLLKEEVNKTNKK